MIFSWNNQQIADDIWLKRGRHSNEDSFEKWTNHFSFFNMHASRWIELMIDESPDSNNVSWFLEMVIGRQKIRLNNKSFHLLQVLGLYLYID